MNFLYEMTEMTDLISILYGMTEMITKDDWNIWNDGNDHRVSQSG